ncbi:hypothetical protein RND71_028412 [Anisodus tanguticus]|uniref:Tf2-1-like SH3-like domain-containing protein n=1 Tax=Anisodus tanguticus TaxID=243964 RepID=A0AAE1RKP1_9SOLA|nr:hypothetical protein RND71_028412 [Anisodus tanguticus]
MVGERVLCKVSPMKGVMRFEKKYKLSLRYIGPFEIVQHIGEVAYELALSPSLSGVHPVFYILMLGWCSYDLIDSKVEIQRDRFSEDSIEASSDLGGDLGDRVGLAEWISPGWSFNLMYFGGFDPCPPSLYLLVDAGIYKVRVMRCQTPQHPMPYGH